MNCQCYDCSHRIASLESKLHDLEYQLDSLKRDLEREVDDRHDAVRGVRSDLSDLYAEVSLR